MTRFKYFLDFDKEERWLMDMAEQGYQLKKGGRLFYRFERTVPEQAIIRVDFQEWTGGWKIEDKFAVYRKQMEAKGWELMAGGPMSGFQYFKQASGDLDIFPDAASRSERYDRFSKSYRSLYLFAGLPTLVQIVFLFTSWARIFFLTLSLGVLLIFSLIYAVSGYVQIQRLRKKSLREG